jgi:hypothetical protein
MILAEDVLRNKSFFVVMNMVFIMMNIMRGLHFRMYIHCFTHNLLICPHLQKGGSKILYTQTAG